MDPCADYLLRVFGGLDSSAGYCGALARDTVQSVVGAAEPSYKKKLFKITKLDESDLTKRTNESQ